MRYDKSQLSLERTKESETMANGSINAKPGPADIFVLFKAWESYFYYYVCAVLFKEKQKKEKR